MINKAYSFVNYLNLFVRDIFSTYVEYVLKTKNRKAKRFGRKGAICNLRDALKYKKVIVPLENSQKMEVVIILLGLFMLYNNNSESYKFTI